MANEGGIVARGKKKPVSEKNLPADNIPVSRDQPFFTLRQSWIIKGAIGSFSTFRRNRFLQPMGGHFDDFLGGIGVFTNETIREWIYLGDKEMEAYHRKYRTGAQPRSAIKEGRRFEEVA
ncbi:MAG: hypothetical protein LBI06_05760 [Treponema sp.]|jgi:hypothetical protein|nr:hypothetical protein [Treponema sp.]